MAYPDKKPKETLESNDIMNQLNLMDIYWTFYLNKTKACLPDQSFGHQKDITYFCFFETGLTLYIFNSGTLCIFKSA